MLTGPLGNAGTWASASGKLPMRISAAAAASATVVLSASLRALNIRRLNLNLCMHPPCWLAVCAAARPANSISSYYPEAGVGVAFRGDRDLVPAERWLNGNFAFEER
jgi:hypothetical protein